MPIFHQNLTARPNTVEILLISGEVYEDHPFSPVGVLARVLDASGFSVAIVEKPVTDTDYLQYGIPELFVGISAGSVDSMLHNYTALKRPRTEDSNSKTTQIPDRALLHYSNKIKQLFKGTPLIIGGVEASLRRFAHYDYWDNKVRRSILLDSRADLMVYGNGEKQIIEIAERRRSQQSLSGIPGTCRLEKEVPAGTEILPSFEAVKANKLEFCKMQNQFSNYRSLAQEYTNNFVVQYHYPEYTSADLDWIYSLEYSRELRPDSLLALTQFSVQTHRGCFGQCNFCAIALHQGERIISRSEKSILAEIKKLTHHPNFKGYIDDLSGPSSNMYGMTCKNRSCYFPDDTGAQKSCNKRCLTCKNVDKSHQQSLSLLKKARTIPGIKKIFIRSGIRYDLAMESLNYITEVSEHHISGCLKIAPEHLSKEVLVLMNKDNRRFEEFITLFKELNLKKKQFLKFYFMVGHPGDNTRETEFMIKAIRRLGLTGIEQGQIFTPTPMSMATAMYYTGLNPRTLRPVTVIRDFQTKKELRNKLLQLCRR